MSSTSDLYPKWVPNSNTFGARLALVRHGMGWNISEAAEAAGVPEANWREWELNGRTPRNIAEVALRISDAARGVDDYWLSTGRQNGIYPNTPDGGLANDDPTESPLSVSIRRPSLYIAADSLAA